jgi:hypothetical protein
MCCCCCCCSPVGPILVSFTDTLNTGLEYVLATVDSDPAACSYSSTTKQVACNLGSLDVSAAATRLVSVVVRVAAEAGGANAAHTYTVTGTWLGNTLTAGPATCTKSVVSLKVEQVGSWISVGSTCCVQQTLWMPVHHFNNWHITLGPATVW